MGEAEEIERLNREHPHRGSEGLCYYCKHRERCPGSGWTEIQGIDIQLFCRESCGGVTVSCGQDIRGRFSDAQHHETFEYRTR